MNNDELKKKIVDILSDNIRWVPYYFISRGIVYEDDLKNIADALISAGIGDMKEAECRARAAELVAKTAAETGILKYEEMKHRAEVAERALGNAVEFMEPYTSVAEDNPSTVEECYKVFLIEAEKELSEEGKEEYKHRAEVAERALDLCETAYILALNGREHEGISQQAIVSDLGVHGFFMAQAEKELSEEEK